MINYKERLVMLIENKEDLYDKLAEVFSLTCDVEGMLEVSKIYCEYHGCGEMFIMIMQMIKIQRELMEKLDEVMLSLLKMSN